MEAHASRRRVVNKYGRSPVQTAWKAIVYQPRAKALRAVALGKISIKPENIFAQNAGRQLDI